jgi:REP element-mobilizing transposase RayT
MAPPQPGLERTVRNAMTQPPVRLSRSQAEALFAQLRETAAFRGWELYACAVMSDHVHVVVGVPGDPDPASILRDFKSYGSHALNQRWGGREARRRWWSRSGSRRRLRRQEDVVATIDYVRRQYRPLVLSAVDTSGW